MDPVGSDGVGGSLVEADDGEERIAESSGSNSPGGQASLSSVRLVAFEPTSGEEAGDRIDLGDFPVARRRVAPQRSICC